MNTADRKPEKPEAASPIMHKVFDGSLAVFAILALAAGVAVWFWKGPAAFDRALDDAWALFKFIMPRVGAAVLIAAFLQLLIPREVVSKLIGDDAGIKSVIIATIAGALTPGGPLTSFPIVVALYVSGANKGALVAYISSWAMIGFQRILVWELPLMGEEFTAIRVGASVLLPIICGTIALYLPIRISIPGGKQ
ncbi:MAG: permease [Rhodospirillaceae bacterium]|jgi:uncharacterized membrane protein YraQ (UPF0718 family)